MRVVGIYMNCRAACSVSFPKFPRHISKLHPQNIMQLVWYKMVLWNITKFLGCKWTLWAVLSSVSSCGILFTVVYYASSVVATSEWCLCEPDDVAFACEIRDTAVTEEIAVGCGDSNGSECEDYCEIRCSNPKECGDSLQDMRHSCDCGDCCGVWSLQRKWMWRLLWDRCSDRKECGDSLQDTRHSCDCGDCCGVWRF